MKLLMVILALLVPWAWAQEGGNTLESDDLPLATDELARWRQLAEEGVVNAQYHLGVIYEYGRGVSQNDREALKWYRQASSQGMAMAQYRLAVMHDNGWGVATDDKEAVLWYRRAAMQGHLLAQYDLSVMYEAGTGVVQDLVQAYKWLSIASLNGERIMRDHLKHLARKLSPIQIKKAERMAREWLERRR